MTTLFAIPASWIPKAHTLIASLAFSTALFVGWASGLWEELCINSVAKWPIEWFPSVSATIGDHAPPRAPFQILIALCATPRFLLLLVQWLVHRYPPARPPKSLRRSFDPLSAPDGLTDEDGTLAKGRESLQRAEETVHKAFEAVSAPVEEALKQELGSTALVDLELVVGIIRTFCCGGWVYITSRDDHDIHDFFMILYLLLTVPWMAFSTHHCTTTDIVRKRRLPFYGFVFTIPPLIWMYYRHSVMRIPGAYTYYSILEWSLVFWDVAFDATSVFELGDLQLAIIDTSTRGNPTLPRPSPSARYHLTVEIRIAVFRAICSLHLAERRRAPVVDQGMEVDWTTEGTFVLSSHWRLTVAWLSDVYYAVCFCTVFTSLGFQLFYWSVWKLALAGSELALLANLSAYTLTSPWARRYVASRQGLVSHRVIAVVGGMGCYFFPAPFVRLVGVSIGTWTGWLSLYGTWIRLKGSEEMIAEGKILGLGLVVTLLLKYANYSTNPFWCIVNPSSGGWNKTGLLLAGFALFEYALRPIDLHPAPPLSVTAKKTETSTHQVANPTIWQRRFISLGLGALIHLIQTFVTDAGTIIAWTWKGYPINGPTLHPGAGVVIGAAALGLVFPMDATSPIGPAIAAIATFTLYTYADWTGFVGGLVLVAYLTKVFPPYLRAASACPPASTLGNALLINIILDVVSVVTAAYAFVPFGWIFRERTDLLLGFCIVSLILGVTAARQLSSSLPQATSLRLSSQRRIKAIERYTLLSVVGLSGISLAYSYGKMPSSEPEPYYPNHRILSGGIWTVHFGVDKEGRDSQRRMMDLIRDMQVDVVGLLETDLHRFVYGNRDLTRVISEELGYYVDLGPGPNKHTWGAALLSKFPIINSTHHLLPSPNGELAPAIHATLDIHGEKVNVFVSHNGQEEDALDRELQTTEIARLLRETEDVPTVFLGYLVTHPGDQRPWPYQILMEDGKMNDIEIEDKWRWCEYIAFRGLWRIAFARVGESDISDTELQVGKFLLPKPGEVAQYESEKEMYWHIGEADVPEPWRMPDMFRGEGVRGHTYVIWDGPLYYLPPMRSELQRYGWGWSVDL